VPLAPAWTVRVEALGYLLLPLVAWGWWAATRRWGFRGLVAGLGLLGVVTLAVRFAGDQTHDGPGPLQWLFLPGLVVAAVEAHDPTRRWLARRRRTPTLWWTLAAFGLLVGSEPAQAALTEHLAAARGVAAAPPGELATLLQEPLRWGAALGVPMQLVGATGLLLGLLALEWQGGRPPVGLDSRVARWFGARSYAFYLVHFAVLGGLLPRVATGQKGIPGLLLLGACALVVSLALTVVLFRWVERPGMLLAARLTGRRPPGPLAADEPAGNGPPADEPVPRRDGRAARAPGG
jgi:peptidoglycan/LPS O-acetylase OafA/YrhL